MGGKSSTSTNQVTIPPEVLARYNSVNQQAQNAASTPFQQYSTDPNAFVAPINQQQNTAISGINAAAGQAQPYYAAATGQLQQAQNSTQPYYDSAGNLISAGVAAGTGLAGTALGSLASGQNASNANIQQAQEVGSGLAGQSYGALSGATSAAAPLQSQAAGNFQNAQGVGQAGTGLAAGQVQNAYSGAQPYNQLATGLAAASAQQVNPSQLDSSSIMQYLSPYLGTVLGNTSKLINQNNQQAQAGQLGTAISSGAFGGDRAGIAAANLAQQQELAAGNVYSGILNTGYNNALSTAQQQQGVDLSAGQANRAALSGAAGQIAGIGAQQFGQGNTTAMDTGTLANQYYNQGLGAGTAQAGLGSQLYGQGANTASQLAALGNQQFGQGMTAAGQQFSQGATAAQTQAGIGQQLSNLGLSAGQAQSGLAGDIYGTGAATSAALAGLGAGAQGAALQGAQAQLGAGTLQQQTQQAGQSALYNQFLQQQSYPFQVDQFLANIAEGTGSLSGSTTTTTQPGGFFSDKRLKEDIKPVGKTYDGQTIYSYKYKGEPKTQIGLLAQEVESKHPHAVGLASGYKTVDYGKATDKAAKRGKFYTGGLVPESGGGAVEHPGAYAFGGSPTIPGISSSDIQSILQSQQAMYAPYGGSSPYSGSGGPYGGSSHVPAPTGSVSHLATAGAPPKQPSMADHIHSVVQAGNDVQTMGKFGQKLGKAAEGLYNDYGSEDKRQATALMNIAPSDSGGAGDHSVSDADIQAAIDYSPNARGGRTGLASGGMPYASVGAGLDIPDDTPGGKLSPGQAPGQAQSGLSQLGSAAGDVASIAKLAKMFANRGGRAGKADGGSLDIPDDQNKTQLAVAAPTSAKDPSMQQAMQIAQIAAMFMNKGGRAGYAGGSTVTGNGGSDMFDDAATDDMLSEGLQPGKKGTVDRATGSPAAPAPADVPRGTVGGLSAEESSALDQLNSLHSSYIAKLGSQRASLGSNPYDVNEPLGPTGNVGMDPQLESRRQELMAKRDAYAKAQVAASSAAMDPGQDGASPRGLSPGVPTPAAAAAKPSGLAPAHIAQNWTPTPPGIPSFPAVDPVTPDLKWDIGLAAPHQYTPTGDGGLSPAPSGSKSLSKSLVDRLKDAGGYAKDMAKSMGLDKKENLIPLLEGIAAMGTAPTRSLGVALATGVGAGAQAYMPTQQAIANVEQTQANTGLIDQNAKLIAAETGMTYQQAVHLAVQNAHGASSFTSNGQEFKVLADGSMMAAYKYNALPHPPPLAGVSQMMGAINNPHIDTMPVARSTGNPMPSAGANPGLFSPSASSRLAIERDIANNSRSPSSMEGAQKNALATRDQMAQEAISARESGTQISNLAQQLSTMDPNGFLGAGGPLDSILGRATQTYNQIVSGAGHPEFAINPDDVDKKIIAGKLAAGMQFAQTSEAGQHSLAALKASNEAIPGKGVPRSAGIELAANLMIDKQKKLDEQAYEINARQGASNPIAYDPAVARQQFGNEHGNDQYQMEKSKLISLINARDSKGNSLLDQLMKDPVRMRPLVEKAFGAPGLTRYIFNDTRNASGEK